MQYSQISMTETVLELFKKKSLLLRLKGYEGQLKAYLT